MSLSKNEICFIFNLNADNTNDKEWKQKTTNAILRKNINKSIEKNKINSLYKILNNLFNTPKTGLQFSKYLELFIQDLFEIKKIDETTKNDIISNIFSIKELVTGRFEHSPRTIFNKIIHNIYNIFDDEKILNLWVENIKIYIHFYNWFLTKIGWLQEKNNKI